MSDDKSNQSFPDQNKELHFATVNGKTKRNLQGLFTYTKTHRAEKFSIILEEENTGRMEELWYTKGEVFIYLIRQKRII